MASRGGMLTITLSNGADHRKGGDRRCKDIGPPAGWLDRRKRVERRLPIVEEDVVPESEWWACFADSKAKIRAEKVAELERELGLTTSAGDVPVPGNGSSPDSAGH